MTEQSYNKLQPEARAYCMALHRWREFQSDVVAARLGERLREPSAFGTADYFRALELLPPPERRPVAFGELVFFARGWDHSDFLRIGEQILPNASPLELDTLDQVRRGILAVPAPDRLPVTIEEFPSRIWAKALASESPRRLISAGGLAINATNALLREATIFPEADDGSVFHVDVGDPALVFDLLALAPAMHRDMKIHLISRLIEKMKDDEFSLLNGQIELLPAWVLLDGADSDERVQKLVDHARDRVGELMRSERPDLVQRHQLRQLGRMLFRLGQRRASIRCAKAIGISPWSQGWQFQPIGRSAHGRIHERLIRRRVDVDLWQADPALASSAMSLPLWLADGVSRAAELTSMFNAAESCPWVFPRLSEVFQWHLAIAMKQSALREVEAMAPEIALRLA